MVIRDLHNFELCENGIIFGWFRLKTYFGEITASDWIVIQHSDGLTEQKLNGLRFI